MVFSARETRLSIYQEVYEIGPRSQTRGKRCLRVSQSEDMVLSVLAVGYDGVWCKPSLGIGVVTTEGTKTQLSRA